MTSSDTIQFEQAASQASEKTGHLTTFVDCFRHNSFLCAARFRLENGLTVVLMNDRRAALFAYQTWFRVGSRDEDPNHTGMAHLLEHLMFKGTQNHPTGEFDRVMEGLGAQTNAATWVDWTYYMQTLAHRGGNLETVMDFEADRVVNLVLDEETFFSELDVVKNERRMSVDNSVSGSMHEALFGAAYREHGYRWPTIGAMEHLEQATVDYLKGFYRTYYAPNNATVVVVGALDVDNTLTSLARHYGPIAAQDLPARREQVEPGQEKERAVSVTKPIAAPQLLLGFHAPAQHESDFAALEILSEALVAGESSRLYQRLVVDNRIAQDVSGYVAPFSNPGLYQLGVQLRPNGSPDDIMSAVEEELSRLVEGISDEEITKAKNSLELGFVLGFKDAEGCAEALGHFETNYGDYSLAFQGTERWADIGRDDLCRVAETVFRSSNRTSVLALPA